MSAGFDDLQEALKDCRLRCGELDASNIKLREALPALWGQYDDEGRKLWVDPAESMRAKCQAIAREEEVKNGSVNGTGAARRIKERIAALKDQP